MARLKQFWIELKTSFWFIPAIINISLIFVAMAVIELDHILFANKHKLPISLVSLEQASVRTFLATIAGSMMTIAGVVFSITILVLAQTAGQYSSRVLRNFMRKRSNQIILGIFVGIFIFCLFLITNLHPTDNALTTLSGFFFALLGVGFLIYFIHQTSISIQASEILRNIEEEITKAIDSFYPDPYEDQKDKENPIEASYPVFSKNVGYIQAVEIGLLLELGKRCDVGIVLTKMLGDFIAEGEEVAYTTRDLSQEKECLEELYKGILIGKFRSAPEDVAYGIQQVVDIALRGLSPGINDLSTAQIAIDYLKQIYIKLSNRNLGHPLYFLENRPLVYAPHHDFEDLFSLGYQAICANAKGQPTIQNQINDSVATIKRVVKNPKRREIVEQFSCRI